MLDKEKKKTKILIVDDDPDIREFLSYNIRKEGYEVFVSTSGNNAIKDTKKIQPDLILLDIMMSDLDGINTCKKIRANDSTKNTLICFLSALSEEYSQLAGFDAGADDYITKPVAPSLLVKKINALLRRAGSKNSSKDEKTKKFETRGLVIDFTTHEVTIKGKKVQLAKKEFTLLKMLVSNPGKVFSREEIYSMVWGNDVVVGDRTIDVHIRKLREKLGSDFISTLKGVGYKFNI